jgi:hypothetical protein
MNISFIHIGKTGGTTIDTLLRSKINKYNEYHLTNNYVGKSYGFGSIPVNKLVFVRDK